MLRSAETAFSLHPHRHRRKKKQRPRRCPALVIDIKKSTSTHKFWNVIIFVIIYLSVDKNSKIQQLLLWFRWLNISVGMKIVVGIREGVAKESARDAAIKIDPPGTSYSRRHLRP